MTAAGSDASTDLVEVLSAPAPSVARRLLGSTFSHAGVTVRLTEVEAYDGQADAASHAYRGRTLRNAVMFGPPGRLYVYLSYGMHHAANLVCGPVDRASAVLLRAGEVVDGVELAEQRRRTHQGRLTARPPNPTVPPSLPNPPARRRGQHAVEPRPYRPGLTAPSTGT